MVPATAVESYFSSNRSGHVAENVESSTVHQPVSCRFKSRTEAARILSSCPLMANTSFPGNGDDGDSGDVGAGPSAGARNPVCSVPFTVRPLVLGDTNPHGIYFIEPTLGGSPTTGLRLVTTTPVVEAPTRRSGREARPGAVTRRTLAAVWKCKSSGGDGSLVEPFR